MTCAHQGTMQNVYNLVMVATEADVDPIQLKFNKEKSRKKSQKEI